MGSESSDVVRFVLDPLLQGQMSHVSHAKKKHEPKVERSRSTLKSVLPLSNVMQK